MIQVSHKGKLLLFNSRQELDQWIQQQWNEMLNNWSHSETSDSYEREKAVRQARKDAILRGELPNRIVLHDHIVCDDPVLHDKDLE